MIGAHQVVGSREKGNSSCEPPGIRFFACSLKKILSKLILQFLTAEIGLSSQPSLMHGHNWCDDGDRNQYEQQYARKGGQFRVPPTPSPHSFDPPHRPGVDRFACEVMRQILGEVLSSSITFLGVFLQTLEGDGFQIARNIGVK